MHEIDLRPLVPGKSIAFLRTALAHKTSDFTNTGEMALFLAD